jgi:hypothetical protein
MFRKAIILSLAVVLALAWLPGSAAAQRSNTLTISIWNGEGSAHQQYQANTATRVRLYYYWYARTEQQVEDFVSRAKFDITLDGETVFNSAAEADAAWQPVEPFTYNGAQIKRAQWSFDLPALTPGQHTIRTIISLDTAVEDGVAPTPFGPGAVHNTTNIVTVYSGQVPSQPPLPRPPQRRPNRPHRLRPPNLPHRHPRHRSTAIRPRAPSSKKLTPIGRPKKASWSRRPSSSNPACRCGCSAWTPPTGITR